MDGDNSVNKEMPGGLKKMVVDHSKNMDTEGNYGHEMEGDLEFAADYMQRAFDSIFSNENNRVGSKPSPK
ncbi:MAG: hypothetical protein RR398_03785 [Clostridia bacterium]